MENVVRILGVAYIFFGQGKLLHVWNAVVVSVILLLRIIGESLKPFGGISAEEEGGVGRSRGISLLNIRDTQ